MGLLGGLVGLGGAEFRLPLLIGMFGFAALAAIIVNKAMSLVVVVAIPARLAAVPLADVLAQWPAVVNLLAGSLLGMAAARNVRNCDPLAEQLRLTSREPARPLSG